MVRLQGRLLDALGVHRLQPGHRWLARRHAGPGVGGRSAERVQAVVAIATSGRHSPWCIALSEAQRAAIRADPLWRGRPVLSANAPEASGWPRRA